MRSRMTRLVRLAAMVAIVLAGAAASETTAFDHQTEGTVGWGSSERPQMLPGQEFGSNDAAESELDVLYSAMEAAFSIHMPSGGEGIWWNATSLSVDVMVGRHTSSGTYDMTWDALAWLRGVVHRIEVRAYWACSRDLLPCDNTLRWAVQAGSVTQTTSTSWGRVYRVDADLGSARGECCTAPSGGLLWLSVVLRHDADAPTPTPRMWIPLVELDAGNEVSAYPTTAFVDRSDMLGRNWTSWKGADDLSGTLLYDMAAPTASSRLDVASCMDCVDMGDRQDHHPVPPHHDQNITAPSPLAQDGSQSDGHRSLKVWLGTSIPSVVIVIVVIGSIIVYCRHRSTREEYRIRFGRALDDTEYEMTPLNIGDDYTTSAPPSSARRATDSSDETEANDAESLHKTSKILLSEGSESF